MTALEHKTIHTCRPCAAASSTREKSDPLMKTVILADTGENTLTGDCASSKEEVSSQMHGTLPPIRRTSILSVTYSNSNFPEVRV